MDNLETAEKQMEIIANMLGEGHRATVGDLANITLVFILYDVAESLRILAEQAMKMSQE